MDRRIDVFCAAAGTAGLSMGVSAALADGGSDAKIVIFEPASTPFLTSGRAEAHSVEGIGIGFTPPLLDADMYDEARAIDEEEGRGMARRLAKEEGLLAGTSTGLNVVGAIEIALELGPGHTSRHGRGRHRIEVSLPAICMPASHQQIRTPDEPSPVRVETKEAATNGLTAKSAGYRTDGSTARSSGGMLRRRGDPAFLESTATRKPSVAWLSTSL